MKNILLVSAALALASIALPAVAHDTDRNGRSTAHNRYMRDYHARIAHRRELREHARLHAGLNAEHAQAHGEGVNGVDHVDTHDALSDTHEQFHQDHPTVPTNR